MMNILSHDQDVIIKKEAEVLMDLQSQILPLEFDDGNQSALSEAIDQLNNLFLLVVVGEFNSGKSAFINALLGEKYLKEGVTPTTNRINLVKFGSVYEEVLISANKTVVYVPVEWLAEINIVDTPGTNAIIRLHESITSKFIPRSDIVLFITSIDRPFTESEKQFLKQIKDWGKKVILIINKIDILENDDDLVKVTEYVSENAAKLLGVKPKVFPLSSRNALQAKLGDMSLWEISRFEQLEQYVHNTLDERERIVLKMQNPLGVGLHIIAQYKNDIDKRLLLLESDINIIDEIQKQLEIYKEDMYSDFNYRIADIENTLLEMQKRGDVYFDETFRLANVFGLLNKDKIRSEFEKLVIADAPKVIEKKVDKIIDWLVNSDYQQWQAVHNYIEERRNIHQDKIIGDVGKSDFVFERERIIEKVSRDTQNIVDKYDKNSSAKKIAESAQAAVAASAALEISAIGLGALITALATTAAADVTGILLASLVAVLGLFVIPAKRKMAKREMTERIASLRKQLIESLHSQIEKEIEYSVNKITDAISPYTRFVRSERKTLETTKSGLLKTEQAIDKLMFKIQKL
jgi:small GTP-binding protein